MINNRFQYFWNITRNIRLLRINETVFLPAEGTLSYSSKLKMSTVVLSFSSNVVLTVFVKIRCRNVKCR